jgi:hypothetical protein
VARLANLSTVFIAIVADSLLRQSIQACMCQRMRVQHHTALVTGACTIVALDMLAVEGRAGPHESNSWSSWEVFACTVALLSYATFPSTFVRCRMRNRSM